MRSRSASTQISWLMSRSVTTDADIGYRVHTLMWRQSKTQRELGEQLGIDQAAVSKRLRGKTRWGAVEVAVTADWLGVTVAELLDHQPTGLRHLVVAA